MRQDVRAIGRVILELILGDGKRESVAKFFSLRIGTSGVTL